MSNTEKTYTLKSSDNVMFEVTEPVAIMSQTIKHIIEDNCSDDGIPLPNVAAKTLAKVIEYCKKYSSESPKSDEDDGSGKSVVVVVAGGEDLKAWNKDFLNVDQAMLFDLILASNYLNIKELLDMTCQTVADMIKGKSPEEIRKTFHIKNDFTPEEEAEIRSENAWAFE